MKKILWVPVFLACAALAPDSYGQLAGVGFDNSNKIITTRWTVGPNFVTVGAGGMFADNDQDMNEWELRGAAYFLGHLHDWEQVDTYFTAGLNARLLDQDNDEFILDAFVGMQPELTLFEHLILSVRFGFGVPILPDFSFNTSGSSISSVSGADFTIRF